MKNLLKKMMTILTLCMVLSVSVIPSVNPGVAIPTSDEESLDLDKKRK